MSKSNFIIWMQETSTVSSQSIKKYAFAIDSVSRELDSYGLSNEKELFDIESEEMIRKIMQHPDFIDKNRRGNNMYGAALNHLLRWKQELEVREIEDEYAYETREFHQYLLADSDNGIRMEEAPKTTPKKIIVHGREVWFRNPRYAREALERAGYLCELDGTHQLFVSKFTEENYVEAHHLIPIQFQNKYKNSLDTHANIISICPMCHRKIHYGTFEEIQNMIKRLFDSRKARLNSSGIDLTIDELYDYYKQ
ncbi:HNH endonuclease [Exiguobacterium sp. Leaf196]|jgi:predicted HNH restriction endonuclease|uniref:HNH endonuclease n=1 Tax=Exiguobacterium sp. Leaf196 TaxID=1736298 RepID=UPI0006F2DD6A|nr:HNH endonuclease [Exiguobacterium sp. Leaf196]KQS37700.1 hypothetical protein ASG02_12040 [Exiguobacterium sp. Leaf196]